MASHRRSLALIVALLLWPLPGRADAPMTLVGFSRDGRRVLLRQGEALVLLGRDGNRIKSAPRSDRDHRHGVPLKLKEGRLRGKGLTLVLDSKGRVVLVRAKQRIVVHGPAKDEACRVTGIEQGMRAPRGHVLALLLRQDCPDAPLAPAVISLPGVGRGLLRRSAALARRGRLDAAEAALSRAAVLLRGSASLTYQRACLAALRGREADALAALRQLKAMGTAAARRLVVKARFDRDFRLIKDSARFKALVGD